ncbi:hypothetical protein P9F83_09490 [Peribacillus psychrosaccharolyticus]|uniref:hypothetical protein n=1 Tax=Peribacillus psychrosaccharolyticus TaxID=1407 RepID=UPI002DBFB0ED|nr:hypothetical protein [Peribacillus psychrosaccharolyticus]MEC2055461.1 hypothetical protein [Peribacillus psychrosaccharolyticus]MED3743509.1 hypothetical protein [Peribacillus psychrosaccharolyticus]
MSSFEAGLAQNESSKEKTFKTNEKEKRYPIFKSQTRQTERAESMVEPGSTMRRINMS